MAKSDRRVKYTTHAIQSAVLELLKSKNIDSLTVKEICELADVNRGTFYLHYSQPRDVLSEIEDTFLNSTTSFYDNYWQMPHNLGSISDTFSWILNNRDLCKILLGDNGNSKFIKKLKVMERNRIIEEWQKEYPSYTRGTLEFLFEFVFHGSMQLILNWIDDNQGLSTTELTHRLDCLGHHALLAARSFHET